MLCNLIWADTQHGYELKYSYCILVNKNMAIYINSSCQENKKVKQTVRCISVSKFPLWITQTQQQEQFKFTKEFYAIVPENSTKTT